MIRALILWLVLAGPALATQQGWPALFDVTGVAPDDVLNIREAPDAGAPIIGSFAPDAEGVEVIRPNADESWGLVNTAEGTGWTSLAFLERRPGQWNGAFPRIARCLGTEPFWSLSLDEDAVTLSTPQETVEGRVALRSGSAARRDRFGLIAYPGGRPLHGILSVRACNDGMSGREYGIAFDAIMGGDVLSGCCSLAD